MRARACLSLAGDEISRFPGKELTHMLGSTTAPGRPGARARAPVRVAFHSTHSVGVPEVLFSRLNTQPMRTPVNASPKPSRISAHDSGSVWFATPSLEETCTPYSLPVSRRTHCQLRRPWYACCMGGAAARDGRSFARLLRCPAPTERAAKRCPRSAKLTMPCGRQRPGFRAMSREYSISRRSGSSPSYGGRSVSAGVIRFRQ